MGNQNGDVVLKIANMTCTACEQRIEDGLLKKSGIVKVSASYAKGLVHIEYNGGQINLEDIKNHISDLHYTVDESRADAKSNGKQWLLSALILAAVVSGYFVLEQTGALYLFPMPDEEMALPVLFLVGLMTSVHCIAMCGGLNISQCASYQASAMTGRYQKLLPSLYYNGGRVVSYTVIGGIVGAIGAVITPSGGFRGAVAIVAAAFMLVMGCSMLGTFPWLRKLVPHLPKRLRRKINREKIGKGPFAVGLLNGLMPCGPLQAMQLYALSTGSLWMGAASMFLFSAGTVPLMFGLGALSSLLSARFTSVMMKVSAVLVLLLGLAMMNNGLSLSGFNPLF